MERGLKDYALLMLKGVGMGAAMWFPEYREEQLLLLWEFMMN